MTSDQPLDEKNLSDGDNPAVLIQQSVLKLSHKIKGMTTVLKTAETVVCHDTGDTAVTGNYAELVASMEKLAKAFETLHRYGDPTLSRTRIAEHKIPTSG